MRKAVNRFDVQVVFAEFTFGVKSRSDVTLTPDDVSNELDAIVKRIRNGGKLTPPADAGPAE
jgi:hypothetical protein